MAAWIGPGVLRLSFAGVSDLVSMEPAFASLGRCLASVRSVEAKAVFEVVVSTLSGGARRAGSACRSSPAG